MSSVKSFTGLSDNQVLESRRQHGSNSLYIRPKRPLLKLLWGVFKEPMFLLLVLACGLYFAIGDDREAWLMMASILFVIAIEVIQEYRSEKALQALTQYSQPHARVLRGGKRLTISVEDIVVGDLLEFAEGERLAADAELLEQHDLSIDEAVITGESLPAIKSLDADNNQLYQGSIVSAGSGIAKVIAVGSATQFGRLGKAIESIETEPTPLQIQIDRFVKRMVLFGLLAFVLVLGINYHYAGAFLPALLFSLAFAMALVPEEIPVAFSAFMALGAAKLARNQVLVKQTKTVESLGSATVVCLDKTGTITENSMVVADLIDYSKKDRVLEYAMWASEPQPFDAMEKAIHIAWSECGKPDHRLQYPFIHEYPLDGQPPMMTHLYKHSDGSIIVAAKGAVERILKVCKVSSEVQAEIQLRTSELASKGYRVLGVASADWPEAPFPAEQDGFPWKLEGLIALHDPPKGHIGQVFDQLYQAGIRVKMITGDHPETARHIALAGGMRVEGPVQNGKKLEKMTDEDLQAAVRESSVFARVFPETKLRIIEALKANGEVVAMTGDGVNDGPALKAAQIGVAMGKRGTEIAKGAASMVLLDDDLRHMVDAVRGGRRIYANLHKAIRYIISIHIPIVLAVLLPLVFGWPFLHILGPVQVIFLELIMDPTCAVAFENEPAEPDIMNKPPRKAQAPLFSWPELSISILQGIVITAGVLGAYWYGISLGLKEEGVRSCVFATMLFSNIFLTYVNRSFTHNIFQTFRYPNPWIWGITAIGLGLLATILYFPPLRDLFNMAPLDLTTTGICAGIALVSTVWIEVFK